MGRRGRAGRASQGRARRGERRTRRRRRRLDLHDTEDRQRTIAIAVSDLASEQLRRPDNAAAKGSGT
jgi:hypothetical protein